MHAEKIALAAELERVLVDETYIEVVLTEHRFADETSACFHGLNHFATDLDLRRMDPAYAKMQRSELKRLIALLRAGADDEQLRAVHFLGGSADE